MQEQSFKSHSRYVPGFHFVTFAVILAALIIAIILLITTGFSLAAVYDVLASVSLGLLFTFLRVFSTGNQDRVIRTEENFRSFRLTGKILNERLTKPQVIALRFADDDEFADLAERAVKENLNSSQIKKAIKQWRADHHRV